MTAINKKSICKQKPVSIGGVLVMGADNAAKLLGVHRNAIDNAMRHGYKCQGYEITRGDIRKILSMMLFLFVIPFCSFAQKTQYANYVTSTQQDTAVIGSCILQTGNVSLIDSTLTINGIVYILHADSVFTDYMDFTDTYYNKYSIVTRQYSNGKLEEIIIQDADDNSKAYCIR